LKTSLIFGYLLRRTIFGVPFNEPYKDYRLPAWGCEFPKLAWKTLFCIDIDHLQPGWPMGAGPIHTAIYLNDFLNGFSVTKLIGCYSFSIVEGLLLAGDLCQKG